MVAANEQLTVAQVRRSLRTFRDYTDDLLRSDWLFGDRLNVFANFCQSDAVFSKIHEQLARNPNVDTNAWLRGNGDVRLSGLRFPVDPDERLSLQHQLVIAGAENTEGLLHQAMMWFNSPGDRISDHVRSFGDAIMRPLFRDLGYRLEEIEERLPEDRSEAVSVASLQIIHVESANLHMNRNQTINVHSSHGFQVGDANTQTNFNITLRDIIEGIEQSSATEQDKTEAKGRLNKFLEHPLVCAVVGGLASTTAAAAGS